MKSTQIKSFIRKLLVASNSPQTILSSKEDYLLMKFQQVFWWSLIKVLAPICCNFLALGSGVLA